MDFMSQFNGHNNGSFVMTEKLMLNVRGWRSNSTLYQARNALIDSGFVLQTRQGWKNTPSLYAVTFYRMNEGAHGLPESVHPSNDWMKIKI